MGRSWRRRGGGNKKELEEVLEEEKRRIWSRRMSGMIKKEYKDERTEPT